MGVRRGGFAEQSPVEEPHTDGGRRERARGPAGGASVCGLCAQQSWREVQDAKRSGRAKGGDEGRAKKNKACGKQSCGGERWKLNPITEHHRHPNCRFTERLTRSLQKHQ